MSDDLPLKQPTKVKQFPSKHHSHNKSIVVRSGPTLVMDMSWDSLMNERLQRKVVSQISMAYSFDKLAKESLPIVFTSVNQRWHELLHRVNAFSWKKEIVSFTNKSLLELDREKLVYLTADTENVCTTLDKDKFYIIGCILDHNSRKGLTREFALEHGIRMERLPIDENISMEGRHVLTINHTAEVLIRVANGMDWASALLATIPPRKHPEKIVKKEVTQEKSWCEVA